MFKAKASTGEKEKASTASSGWDPRYEPRDMPVDYGFYVYMCVCACYIYIYIYIYYSTYLHIYTVHQYILQTDCNFDINLITNNKQ